VVTGFFLARNDLSYQFCVEKFQNFCPNFSGNCRVVIFDDWSDSGDKFAWISVRRLNVLSYSRSLSLSLPSSWLMGGGSPWMVCRSPCFSCMDDIDRAGERRYGNYQLTALLFVSDDLPFWWFVTFVTAWYFSPSRSKHRFCRTWWSKLVWLIIICVIWNTTMVS